MYPWPMNQNNRGRRRASLPAPTLLAVSLLAAAAPAAAAIEVEAARAELRADDPQGLAAYFVLRNATTHELELLKAVADGADRVEYKLRSYDAENRPRVWPLAKFEVAAGDTLKLSPEGRFFRITGFTKLPRPGDRITFTLVFEDEPPLVIVLPVAAGAAAR